MTPQSAQKQILTLVALSIGLFSFFCLAAILEEKLFTANNKEFKFGWFLTFIQLVFVTIFSGLERLYFKEKVTAHNAELKRHALVAGAMTASRGLTNVSLQFLNYPTQVVFKSLKLLTVMLGSACFVGRSYKITEYVATGFTVLSAVLFGFGDLASKNTSGGQPSSSMMGFVIVTLSLVADSMHSNTQETLLQDYKATIRETMFYTNLFAAWFSLAVCTFTGELFAALAYCLKYPDTWTLLAVQSLVTYLGVLCFVTMIKSFGAVLATTVTTVRKIVTVMLSFIFFEKPFNNTYLVGIGMFVISFIVQFFVQYQQIQAGLGLGKNVDQQQQQQQQQSNGANDSAKPANKMQDVSKGQYEPVLADDDTDIELKFDLVDVFFYKKKKKEIC